MAADSASFATEQAMLNSKMLELAEDFDNQHQIKTELPTENELDEMLNEIRVLEQQQTQKANNDN